MLINMLSLIEEENRGYYDVWKDFKNFWVWENLGMSWTDKIVKNGGLFIYVV